MTIGKYIAAGVAVVAIVLLVLSLAGVAAASPAWLVFALILALAGAVVVG